MRSMRFRASLLALALVSAPAAATDPSAINRITDQAMNHGQVAETAAYLTDRIGGRLTNSPAMREAERWTLEKFRQWGLENVRREGFDFGRGWWIESSSVRMVTPRPLSLRAIPVAWTPATSGAIAAPIIVAPITKADHFAAWRGRLAGKIVLVSLPADARDDTTPPFRRLTSAELGERDQYIQPDHDPDSTARMIDARTFERKLDAFLKQEGALAWARMSTRDNGLVGGTGYAHKVGQTPALPGVELAAEDYRRLARLAKTGPVTLEIDSRVHFDDSDRNAYNILAEIPGTDPKAGYVMAGAHLDSWVAADGAADNADGAAVIMEAARILSALGVRPKRTIRFALWAGEEQGVYGSFAYIRKHLAIRARHADPAAADLEPYFVPAPDPATPLPGFRDMVAYFNSDGGAGKVRGIGAEGNFAAIPILREWLAPLASLGASTVVARSIGGSDHVGMARLGLPAFAFIQDPLDYGSRVHHGNLDTFDHLRTADLRQAAVVTASMLLSAADSEKTIPRNVLPSPAADTNPFDYQDPEDR